MIDMDKDEFINEFAQQWLYRFKNKSDAFRSFEESFGEDCMLLGFEMDCGKAFQKYFNDDHLLYDYELKKLPKVIDKADNLEALKSGVFSQWRYITHWSDYATEEDFKKRIPWIVLVLKQIYKLTKPDNKTD